MEGISNFWNQFWSNVPDVIVALLVLILAFIVAAIAKALATKLVKIAGLERGLAKAGIDKENVSKTTNFLGQLVYLIVFVLFLPGIFEKLGLNNVATPIVSMMNTLMTYLPNIIGAIIIAMVGLFIAKLVKELLSPLFGKLKINEKLAKLGINTEKVNVADILATAAYVVIAVFFVVEALSTLQLSILTRIGNDIVAYLPYALSAAAVLLIAFILGSWVESTLAKKFSVSKFTALAAKVAIIITGVFMALSQLGVASTLVNSTFIITIGAIAVAFAISFGLGGREFASHQMKKLEQKMEKSSKK